MEKKPKAGRKFKSESLRIKSIAWAFAAKNINDPFGTGDGLLPKYSLNKYLPDDIKFDLKTFKEMKQSVRTPTESTLTSINDSLPNSRRYFDTGIWELTFYESFGKIPIKKAFDRLDPVITKGWQKPQVSEKIFWRNLKKDNQVKVAELAGIEDYFLKNEYDNPDVRIEILQCVAFLMHESVLLQDLERLNICHESWKRYLNDALSSRGRGTRCFSSPDIRNHLINFSNQIENLRKKERSN